MLVVSRLACPSQLRITVTSTSAVTRLTAVACLNLCGETRLLSREGTFLPAAAAYCFNLKRTPEALRGFPYRFTKMGSSSRRASFSRGLSAVRQSRARAGRFVLFSLYRTGEHGRAIPNEGPWERGLAPLEC